MKAKVSQCPVGHVTHELRIAPAHTLDRDVEQIRSELCKAQGCGLPAKVLLPAQADSTRLTA